MHELRKDPLMNRWIAVLSDSMSPGEYNLQEEEAKESECVLCSGREKNSSRNNCNQGKWFESK